MDKQSFDVTSASYALTTTASTTATVVVNMGIHPHEVVTPAPPPRWSKDRSYQYASKLEALNPELGKLARSVWQTFYSGTDSAERASLGLMRQLYDHFFSVLAPDDKVQESPFFKKKEGDKPLLVHRRERLQYAASVRVTDKALGEMLASEADQVLRLYEELNRFHARNALNKRVVRESIPSMEAVIEQWVDAIGLEYRNQD